MVRNILDYQGNVIGEAQFADDTPEEVIQARLAQFALPPASPNVLRVSIDERRAYAIDLIKRLKERNIQQGINALQAMWMHSKMRALPVTFMGVGMDIDILNLVISGDVEVACLALQNCTPDDMSQPYHWFNQERVDWIIADLKGYLGWP